MKDNIKKTVLITGATSGIGLEFALVCAKNGHDLVLVARKKDVLHTLAKELEAKHDVAVTVIVKDLSDPQSPLEIFNELQHKKVFVDILINNAGFATHGFFAQSDIERELQMMQVNMISLTHLTRVFLPAMIQQKYGRILNMASTAAFLPGPLMAVYYASKAYVLSFSEALANELQGTGVTVTALCPGPTKTHFAETAHVENSRLFQGNILTPLVVARAGYLGMMKGRTVVIPRTRDQFLTLGARLLSGKLAAAGARYLQERGK